MNITLGSLIGDFILVAGSFLLLIILIKKFAWENITSTFEQRAKKISDDIDSAESARQKAEDLAQKRETELAGSRQEATTIIENAKVQRPSVCNAIETTLIHENIAKEILPELTEMTLLGYHTDTD